MLTSGDGAPNHGALQKIFPLEKGDGVCHTYDVLHGARFGIVWPIDAILFDSNFNKAKTK